MAIFTKLFCTFFGSIAGAFLLHAFDGEKSSSRSVALSVATGLFLGGMAGLQAGREIIKDDSKPK